MKLYKPMSWGVAIFNPKTGEQTGAAVGMTISQAIGRQLTKIQHVSLGWNGFLLAR